MHVRAVIPHYFQELKDGEQVQIGEGFGSRQRGARQRRTVALQRCLSGLINLQRSRLQLILDLKQAQPSSFEMRPMSGLQDELSVEIVVAIHTQETCLDDVLLANYAHLRVLPCPNIDPRYLGFAARDYLLHHPQPADLNLYLEDDLVVHDSFLIDKLLWIAEVTDHSSVLMPHRYELLPSEYRCSRLLIDGKIPSEFMSAWHVPCENVFSSQFLDHGVITFDRPSNPHSGFFALSRAQAEQLSEVALPVEGFNGPLETAATLTVGKYFQILKPCLHQALFCWIEHGSPSFLGYVGY